MTALRGLATTIRGLVVRCFSLDWFWSLWLTAVVVAELVTAAFFGRDIAAGIAGIPVYVGVAGAVSLAYAFLYENFLQFRLDPKWWVPRATTTRHRRGKAVPRSTGESLIPGVIGMVVFAASIALAIAIRFNDLAVLVVGLPIVFGVAPLFVLFAYGYTRDEPAIGGRAYRAMPWGLGIFLGGALLVRLARDNHWMEDARTVLIGMLVALAVAFLALNAVANIRARSDEAGRQHT